MPRDGSSIYHVPPGTQGVPDTTISSTVYNAFLGDLEGDLNAPRPIVAGGTGASDAHSAMIALSGEIAAQVVTNYDTFAFQPGSFTSAPGATSAPDGTHYFSGICYQANSGGIFLEARQHSGLTPPVANAPKWFREKWASWGPWFLQAGSTADLDAAYVNVSGDTMTGPLTVNNNMTVNGNISCAGFQAAQNSNSVVRYNFMNQSNGSGAFTILDIYNDAGIVGEVGVLSSTNNAYSGPGSMVFLSTGKMGFFPTGNMEINGPVKITNTTASTSPYTGSLTVAGGVGITGSINVLASGGPTLDTDGSTQAVITGPDCAGQLGNLAIISNSPAADGAGGSIAFAGQFSGGSVASFAKIKGYRIGGSYTGRMALQTRDSGGSMLTAMLISEVQNVSIPTTTSSSSPTTGALTVAGGVGVGGALNAAAVVGGGSGVWSVNSVNTGVYEFGSDGHQYLQFDGSTFRFVGGSVYVPVPSVNMGITLGRGGSYAYVNSNAAGVSLLQDSSFFEGTGSQNNTVMHVNRISSNGPVVVFDQTGTIVGSISVTTTATAYNTSSDLRLKEDLKSFDAGNIIDKTEVYDFKWKSVDERSYGVIAQQAKEIYPTAVAYDEHNDWWGIDYSKYVPVLLQELKALRLRVAQLEAKVNQ